MLCVQIFFGGGNFSFIEFNTFISNGSNIYNLEEIKYGWGRSLGALGGWFSSISSLVVAEMHVEPSAMPLVEFSLILDSMTVLLTWDVFC